MFANLLRDGSWVGARIDRSTRNRSSFSSSATHQQGNEAAIFKAVVRHSIVLASLVGLIVMFYAYVAPSLIP